MRAIKTEIRLNKEGNFRRDQSTDLDVEIILAYPPFNVSDRDGEQLKHEIKRIAAYE